MRRLLYVTKSPFYPDCSGGAELSTLYLLGALARRGWRVEVLCALSTRVPHLWQASRRELARLGTASCVVTDDGLGYPCRRFVAARDPDHEWPGQMEQRLDAFEPDVVLGAPDPFCTLLEHAADRGCACFYAAHNLAALERAAQIPPQLNVIANAPFTARALSARMGREVAVVHEMIDPDLYRAPARAPATVTFVNPIPEKGLDVALGVARELPGARFLFVKGKWATIDDAEADRLLAPAAALPNVDVWEHQADMRNVYAATHVLLVPSQFPETFGRVIVEAHLNGIPVVASDSGGIPYALGKGGLLVGATEPPHAFADAVSRLRGDAGLYAALSNAARDNSRRPEFDPVRQVDAFVRVVTG